MAATTTRKRRHVNEEIDVSRFKDIQIQFPGDAYILAVWLAMSDRSKSTPTCQPHTTLLGLARNFAILHGTDYANPLTTEDVMTVFRQHGITGNPLLRLEEIADELLSLRAVENCRGRLPAPIVRTAEPSGEPEPPMTLDLES